jgi:hemoglobin-like flavoprotein
MDPKTLEAFDASLERCTEKEGFFDRFYEKFLASSPKVKEKFANTDFVRQKKALRTSLYMMYLAAANEKKNPGRYLRDLAERHSRRDLDIGSDFYDLWLDSLLETARGFDPQWNEEVEQAWERVMIVGISYMLSRY